MNRAGDAGIEGADDALGTSADFRFIVQFGEIGEELLLHRHLVDRSGGDDVGLDDSPAAVEDVMVNQQAAGSLDRDGADPGSGRDLAAQGKLFRQGEECVEEFSGTLQRPDDFPCLGGIVGVDAAREKFALGAVGLAAEFVAG